MFKYYPVWLSAGLVKVSVICYHVNTIITPNYINLCDALTFRFPGVIPACIAPCSGSFSCIYCLVIIWLADFLVVLIAVHTYVAPQIAGHPRIFGTWQKLYLLSVVQRPFIWLGYKNSVSLTNMCVYHTKGERHCWNSLNDIILRRHLNAYNNLWRADGSSSHRSTRLFICRLSNSPLILFNLLYGNHVYMCSRGKMLEPRKGYCNGVTQMVVITRYVGVIHTERDQCHW